MKNALRFGAWIALTAATFGQAPPKDVYGWGKLRWGMTVAQAKALYGAQVRDSDGKDGPNADYTERLVIDSLAIGDVKMKVSISIDPKSKLIKDVEQVRKRTRAFLEDRGATVLVSSAACGADLVALSEAGQLGMRRRVILPFARKRFRATSVSDRPGGWGSLYDQILDQVDSVGDLVILGDESDEEAYSAANQAILDEAIAIGKSVHEFPTAVLVWDGISRGDHDLTEEFAIEARNRGLEVIEVRSD